MGKIRVFDILFESPHNVFHSGEKVIGIVKVQNTVSVKVQKITLEIVGKGKVHWTKTTGSGEHRNTKHYRSEEYYVNHSFILLQPERGESDLSLPEGTHDLPFECDLPRECPTSFEGAYGYVRYWCKANFGRPWKFDIEAKSAFTVLSNFDLNTNPTYGRPCTWNCSREVDCCCCVGGEVEVDLRITKTGFVPGEPVIINGTIKNNTNTEVGRSICALQQSVDFYGLSGSMFSSGTPKAKNTTSDTKRQVVGEAIPAGQTQVWDNVKFFIPPLPPTGLQGANYINIDYTLKVGIYPNWGDNIKLTTPVAIGTVPIVQLSHALGTPEYNAVVTQPAPAFPSAPFMQQSTEAPPSAPPDPSAPPPYDFSDLPPPSYEECVSGRVHIRDEGESQYVRGNMEYAPSYTYYDWASHQSRIDNPTRI